MKNGKQTQAPEPPEHFSDRAKALWIELVRHRCDSVERQVLLRYALEDLDRADRLREQITRDGETVVSKRSGLARLNPALKVEAEARRRFFSAWKALALTWPARVGFHP